jgi:ABC-type Fe3+/spermidine/putrescine transport system ATPase subunit
MSYTPEREEANTLSQATSAATVSKESILESKEKKAVVQPKVTEVYKDENERRLAEFCIEKDKIQAASNGAQAREKRDKQITSLTGESDKVRNAKANIILRLRIKSRLERTRFFGRTRTPSSWLACILV